MSGLCGGSGPLSCDLGCVCEIQQTLGADLSACQDRETVPDTVFGFCYIDADIDLGNPELVADCPAVGRRWLRFVGADTPAPGASVFITCGASDAIPD
jgi:hypothetical protein